MLSSTTLIIFVVACVWLASSTIFWTGLRSLKQGTWEQQKLYKQTSTAEMVFKVLFAPVYFLAAFLKSALANWHITSAFLLVIIMAVALTGCQTNVNTMPNATIMIDSGMSCTSSQ